MFARTASAACVNAAFKRDEEPPGQQSGDLQAQWENLLQDHVSLLERPVCILTAEEETGRVTSDRQWTTR